MHLKLRIDVFAVEAYGIFSNPQIRCYIGRTSPLAQFLQHLYFPLGETPLARKGRDTLLGQLELYRLLGHSVTQNPIVKVTYDKREKGPGRW